QPAQTRTGRHTSRHLARPLELRPRPPNPRRRDPSHGRTKGKILPKSAEAVPKVGSSSRKAGEQPRSVAPRNSNHQKPLGAMAIIVQGFGARQDPGLNANKKRRLYAPPRWVHHPFCGLRRPELEVGLKRPEIGRA